MTLDQISYCGKKFLTFSVLREKKSARGRPVLVQLWDLIVQKSFGFKWGAVYIFSK